MPAGCLIPSSRPSRQAWAWACRSAVPSLTHMADACGRPPSTGEGRCLSSRYPFRREPRRDRTVGVWAHEPPDPMVVVVDDDSSMRDAVINLLRSVGLHVIGFTSAHELLQSD